MKLKCFGGVFLLLGLALSLGCGQTSSPNPDVDSSKPQFIITHAGPAVSRTWIEVTMAVHNSQDQVWPDWTGTITLSTDSGTPDQISWRNKTGVGDFTDGGTGSDQATYTFVAADGGQVKFEIQVDSAQTIKIYASSEGEVKGTSADLEIGGGGGGETTPQWFPWWGGESVPTCNSFLSDDYAPINSRAGAWVGIYGDTGTQDDPARMLHSSNNKGLDDRVAQGFDKIMIEAERGLSRNEIRTLLAWCREHPHITVFLWCMSWQWEAPYGSYRYRDWTGTYPLPDGTAIRLYFHWDEYADCPDNLILCFELYYCQDIILGGDFTDKVTMAQREVSFLEDNYWRLIEMYNLQEHSIGILGLGGPKWYAINFTSEDLAREMNLMKSKFTLGIGFFSGSSHWSYPWSVTQADQFCQNWIDEFLLAGFRR